MNESYISDDQPRLCGSCVFRNLAGICTYEKLSVWGDGGEDASDMLIHDKCSGGNLFVGEKFGCVHHVLQRVFK